MTGSGIQVDPPESIGAAAVYKEPARGHTEEARENPPAEPALTFDDAPSPPPDDQDPGPIEIGPVPGEVPPPRLP